MFLKIQQLVLIVYVFIFLCHVTAEEEGSEEDEAKYGL